METKAKTRTEEKQPPKTGLYRTWGAGRRYGHQMSKKEIFDWRRDMEKMLGAMDKSPFSSRKLRASLVTQLNQLHAYLDTAYPGWRGDLGIPEGEVML